MDEFKQYIEDIGNFFKNNGWNFLLGLVVLIVGLAIVKIVKGVLKRLLVKNKKDAAMASFFIALGEAIADILLIIGALSIMGVNTASILTVIATGGVAIGLALKDSLGNIASGIMIIINKPFKRGDYISVAGVEGKIDSINLFNTQLTTWDNRVVVVPNSSAINNPLVNCDSAEERRIDIDLGFDYGTDLKKVRELVKKVVDGDDRLVEERPVTIAVMDFGESAVSMGVRVWTKTENYWDVKFDMLENIYNTLYANGIGLAYNHVSVDLAQKEKKNDDKFAIGIAKPKAQAASVDKDTQSVKIAAVEKDKTSVKIAAVEKDKSADKKAGSAKANAVPVTDKKGENAETAEGKFAKDGTYLPKYKKGEYSLEYKGKKSEKKAEKSKRTADEVAKSVLAYLKD